MTRKAPHVADGLLKALYLVLPRGIENRIGGKDIQLHLAHKGHPGVDLRTIKEACRQLVFRGIPCGGIPGTNEGYYMATTQKGYERLRSIPESQALSGLARVEALDRAWRWKTALSLPLESSENGFTGLVCPKLPNASIRTTIGASGQESPIITDYNNTGELSYDLLVAIGKYYFLQQGKSLEDVHKIYGISPMWMSRFVKEYGAKFGLRLWHKGPRGKADKIDRGMYGRWIQAVDAWAMEKLKKLLPEGVAERVMNEGGPNERRDRGC